MESEQRMGQAPVPPQVVVVQQPIIVGRPRPLCCPAYVLRGTKFANGCNCNALCIIMLFIIGSVVLYLGGLLIILLGSFNPAIGIIPFIIGGVITFSGCRLCCIARRQFNALPSEHPDRTKYTQMAQGVVAMPAVGQTASTYTFPAGTQVVNYPPPNTALLAPQSPHRPEQAAGYPVPATVRVTPTDTARATLSASGRATPSAPMYSNPEDPPPSYLQVAGGSQFKCSE